MSYIRKQTLRLLRQLAIVLSCGWGCCGGNIGDDRVVDSGTDNIERRYWSPRRTSRLEGERNWVRAPNEQEKVAAAAAANFMAENDRAIMMTLQVPVSSLSTSRRSTMDSLGTLTSSKSPTPSNNTQPSVRSVSNYCRVSTCEQLHIHELTPKCLETFAPSSTHSSCQNCDRQHIGPNHSEVMLVSQLYRHLNSSRLLIQQQQKIIAQHQRQQKLAERALKSELQQSMGGQYLPVKDDDAERSRSVMEQPRDSNFWPLPDYRPQHSPDHLYRTFGFY